MVALLDQGLMSDVTLLVGAAQYRVHKVVLCASSDVFQVSPLISGQVSPLISGQVSPQKSSSGPQVSQSPQVSPLNARAVLPGPDQTVQS